MPGLQGGGAGFRASRQSDRPGHEPRGTGHRGGAGAGQDDHDIAQGRVQHEAALGRLGGGEVFDDRLPHQDARAATATGQTDATGGALQRQHAGRGGGEGREDTIGTGARPEGEGHGGRALGHGQRRGGTHTESGGRELAQRTVVAIQRARRSVRRKLGLHQRRGGVPTLPRALGAAGGIVRHQPLHGGQDCLLHGRLRGALR